MLSLSSLWLVLAGWHWKSLFSWFLASSKYFRRSETNWITNSMLSNCTYFLFSFTRSSLGSMYYYYSCLLSEETKAPRDKVAAKDHTVTGARVWTETSPLPNNLSHTVVKSNENIPVESSRSISCVWNRPIDVKVNNDKRRWNRWKRKCTKRVRYRRLMSLLSML